MEIEDSMHICSNCNKPIPEEKLMIHEAYCFRNFKKCPKCHEMIDKNQQKEHENEFHNEKACKHCGKCFEGPILKSHELFCEDKPKVCSFCTLEIKSSEFSEHVYNCSTRTQQCEFCQKFIMKRDYDDHLFKCFQNNLLNEKNFPHLNEENKNQISKEEKKTEDSGSHSKKKLESPKLHENPSPSLKKKNSKTQNNSSEYENYWEQQDEINHYGQDNMPFEHHFHDQDNNNILLPNLPLTNNQSYNEDPELQKILYESLASKKN